MLKRTKIVLACILLLTLVTVVMATSYYIYSTPVNVPITTYTLFLTVSPTSIVHNNNVTLTATLKQNAIPYGSGLTIQFGKGIGASDFVSIGTNTTTVGVATFKYNVTETATSINFVARYLVP